MMPRLMCNWMNILDDGGYVIRTRDGKGGANDFILLIVLYV